jgi:uncharacterized membrane protein YqiK
MSPDDVHRILEPLLLAIAISVLCFAVATVLLWRHGRRMKRDRASRAYPIQPSRS